MSPFPSPHKPLEVNVEALRAVENEAMAALKRKPRRGVLGDLKRFIVAATKLRARLEMLEATREVEEASLFDGIAPSCGEPAPTAPAAPPVTPAPVVPATANTRKPRKAQHA